MNHELLVPLYLRYKVSVSKKMLISGNQRNQRLKNAESAILSQKRRFARNLRRKSGGFRGKSGDFGGNRGKKQQEKRRLKLEAPSTSYQKMQNKTNFRREKMNITSGLTKTYKMNSPTAPAKTKPIKLSKQNASRTTRDARRPEPPTAVDPSPAEISSPCSYPPASPCKVLCQNYL